MDAIFKYFNDFTKLSLESRELISSHLEFDMVKKNDLLWKVGQRCTKIYFIESGIVRLFFYNESGEENTVHFVTSNKFITDIDSLNTKVPSSVSCVAVTECRVVILNQSALEKFNKDVFEWHELIRKITEKSLFEKIKIRERVFQKEATERYLSFLEHFPGIANTVQARHIASYLGISQFTLSHIKKNIQI